MSAVVWVLLFVWTELPSQIGRIAVTCPVCGMRFKAVVVVRQNTFAGVDRDLFARAIGPQPEYYRVSTCPKCYYSGYPEDFREGLVLMPDVQDKVRRLLPELLKAAWRDSGTQQPPVVTPATDQREIPALVRYRLAARCYRWRQKSDEAIAWLYLRGSWVARDEGSILPPEPRVARMMKYVQRWLPPRQKGDNQADRELILAARLAAALAEGHFNEFQRPYAELVLALLLRRHGENHLAAPVLDKLARHSSFPKALAQAIEKMRDSIARERWFQQRAIDHLQAAMHAGQVAARNRASACYLLGELHRRLGDRSQALVWYDRALWEPNLPENLASWLRWQRQTVVGMGWAGSSGSP